jgi:hypothetical protein
MLRPWSPPKPLDGVDIDSRCKARRNGIVRGTKERHATVGEQGPSFEKRMRSPFFWSRRDLSEADTVQWQLERRGTYSKDSEEGMA